MDENLLDLDESLQDEYTDVEEIQELIETKKASEDYIHMDYNLETAEERNLKVKEIIEKTPTEKLTPKYLEKLADYIVFAMDKQEKKQRKILTDNRMVTVNDRETSYEGLVGKLENGEDGIYNMIANDKNIIFKPKVEITPEDIAEIPGLRELREAIDMVEAQSKNARGRKAFLLKKQLIEMRKQQYIMKNSYRQPMYCMNLIKSFQKIDLSENIIVDENGNVKSDGIINFFEPTHISAILCNYSKLKEDTWANFNSDAKWMLMDLDNLIDETLKEKYPLYYDLLIYKIDGKQNVEIQELLEQKHGIKHSIEYISSLWRNKIPKLIADKATDNWLYWHYTFEEKGKWKHCSRCGQIKLAHNRFFSKNTTSKDGLYSICKECRNKKK